MCVCVCVCVCMCEYACAHVFVCVCVPTDVVALTGCARSCLGICASSSGAVAGLLLWQVERGKGGRKQGKRGREENCGKKRRKMRRVGKKVRK